MVRIIFKAIVFCIIIIGVVVDNKIFATKSMKG